MFRALIGAVVICATVSCGGAPAPTRSNAQTYTVISEQADRSANSLTLLIRVPGPITEASAKPIIESAIAARKGEFSHIIVKAYAEGSTASDQPFAISRLENGQITHRFSSMAESQKIQTH